MPQSIVCQVYVAQLWTRPERHIDESTRAPPDLFTICVSVAEETNQKATKMLALVGQRDARDTERRFPVAWLILGFGEVTELQLTF